MVFKWFHKKGYHLFEDKTHYIWFSGSLNTQKQRLLLEIIKIWPKFWEWVSSEIEHEVINSLKNNDFFLLKILIILPKF